jgi:GR25 family glycosyltransferase involved in LPS biosynthesis
MAYPILILAYRRSEELIKVIESVQQLKPSKIYFHIHDAPNEEQQKDVELAKAVIRAYKGPKETKYSKEPLGVRASLYTAVRWVAEKEPLFFVFEDDVVLRKGSSKKILKMTGELAKKGGLLKFGPNRDKGVFWGWAATSKEILEILDTDVSSIPYDTMSPYFEDKYHYLGIMEMYKREMNMAWDDELNMVAKVKGTNIITSKKEMTAHIGKVSTRTGNGLDKGFGEGSYIMFKNGKIIN